MKNTFLTGLMVAAVSLSSSAPLPGIKKAESIASEAVREPAPFVETIDVSFSNKAPKLLPSKRPYIAPLTQTAPTTDTVRSTKTIDAVTAISSDPLSSTKPPKSPLALVVDKTPPTVPPYINVQGTLSNIQADWGVSEDPESGIAKYVYGIGTNSTGDYNSLPNVRWWKITYVPHISVTLPLDPNLTYYVSVYAVNGAGIKSEILTSGPIHPGWSPIGTPGNTITLQFAPQGIDTKGGATTGWTPAQISTMNTFFSKMYPIIEDLYGPPAKNYTVTVVRDLRYNNSNIFLPSSNEIHKDDTFNAQLFTHELVHAFRDDYILSSNENWSYDPTLSGFEESFAQAVSYDAMNKYVELYPKDSLVPPNSLWGSSTEWNYDYQNVPELRGTDFWSDNGGTGLYRKRYEVGAAAMKKIDIESPGFYKNFNQEYYRRINEHPESVRSTRSLIVDIIAGLVPMIEGQTAYEWINKQHIFYAKNVYGQKIFQDIQDYPYTQFFAFDKMYFLNTMSCGSDWACWNGKEWVYYRLNGSQGEGKLTDINGRTVWSGNLAVQPVGNPSEGTFVIGKAIKTFTTATTTEPWPGGNPNDFVLNLNTTGLYKFTASFTDPVTSARTTNSFYRVFGAPIANSHGVYGGVLNHRNGTIYLNHEGFEDEPGIPVVNGAFVGDRLWTGIHNPRTGSFDSVPGKVSVTFVDSNTNQTFHAQRNIGYGSALGNQMFLFDFPIGQGGYGTPGSHGTTNPLPNDQ